MRLHSLALTLGAALARRQRMLISLAVLTAYAVAVPPTETLGSSDLEHFKDLLAFSFAFLGLTFRSFAANYRPARPRHGWRSFYFANLVILLGIFLMHGDFYVVSVGFAASVLMYFLMLGADRASAAGETAPSDRRSIRRHPLISLILVSARDWQAIVLTFSVLLLTEVYEYMPKESAESLQLVLLALSGSLMLACLGSLFVIPRLQARQGTVALPLGPATRGLRVDGRAGIVDLLENMISLGRLRRILDSTLNAAALRPNDRLLDVGCGTGRLAIKATSALGAGGTLAVHATGIDATPGMIELARNNARRAKSPARFQIGVGESLSFDDGTMDAVISSYFFHHLPSDVKRQALREMWRVLAPGGRLVITDYGRPNGLIGQIAAFPMRFDFHEYVRGQLSGELEELIKAEGLSPIERVDTFLGYICVLRIVKTGI
jgi:ubiquinone/menaquinone biosynthesis C-methylase UbiE